MKVSLVVLTAGKASGQTIQVQQNLFVIGRDPQCQLRPASPSISKKHCALLIKNGQVLLRDFESTNGTFINDQPVKQDVTVNNGDVLKAGPLQFRVVIEGKPVAVDKPTPPPPISKLPIPPSAPRGGDEDALAMLLGMGDEGTTSDAADANIPSGSTIMDMPIPAAASPAATEPGKPTPAPEPKKPEPAGSARDAAKAILDRYSKRPRR